MKEVMRLLSLTGVAAAAVLFSPVLSAMPVVELSADAVTVRSLAPGSAVALFSVAREAAPYMARVVVRRELLADDDNDGIIRYEPDGGVAVQSIWIVVDRVTGETVPAARDRQPFVIGQRGTARGTPVSITSGGLEFGRNAVDVLVVRPGGPVWIGTGVDGNIADADGLIDGRLRITPSMLVPLQQTSAGPPAALQEGDVIVAVDSERLQYSVTRVQGGN